MFRFLACFSRMLTITLLCFSGLASHALNITVDNYGRPGATTSMVKTRLIETETSATHHDIWIIQGGINNLNYSNGNLADSKIQLTQDWLQIRSLAQQWGVDVYYCELTPVASAEVDPVTAWAPVNPKIQFMNLQIATLKIDYQIKTVLLYGELEPHWTALPDAWCLNLANSGRIDGGHPNALGARAIAERLYAAIRPAILPRSNTSIAIFGDSIVATVYLPANQRIDALMKTYAQQELTALCPHAWQFYE